MKFSLSMSTLRLGLLAVAAIGSAALAVFAANQHIARSIEAQRAAERRPQPPSVSVVVAKFDLVAGEPVGPDNMALRSLPADMLPASAIRPEQFDAQAGMRLTRALRSGEPLLAEILQPAEPPGLSMRVRQGIRALTLAVDEVSSVSGMLRPGDRIDLLFTARAPAGSAASGGEMTRVLAQDVPVLATGRQTAGLAGAGDAAQRGFTAITMELGPEDAKRVVAAQRAGRITAMLRHPDDRHPVSATAVDIHSLLGIPRAPEATVVQQAVNPGPEVITGGLGHGGPRSRVEPASRSVATGTNRSPDQIESVETAAAVRPGSSAAVVRPSVPSAAGPASATSPGVIPSVGSVGVPGPASASGVAFASGQSQPPLFR